MKDNPTAMENGANPWFSLPEGFVWWSNENSVERKQVSVVAVAETLVCFPLFLFIALHWTGLFIVSVAAVAAPFLLLRSPMSIDCGRKILAQYWQVKSGDLSRLDRFILLPVALIFEILGVLLIGVFAFNFCETSLPVLIFCVSLVLGALGCMIVSIVPVAMVCPLAFAGAIVQVSRTRDRFYLHLATAGVISSAGLPAYLLAGPLGLAGALIGAGYWSAVLWASMDGFSQLEDGEVEIPRVSVACAVSGIGLIIRTVFIRIRATLPHLYVGLERFRENWRETMWVQDMFSAPVLLPDAQKVSPLFSVVWLGQRAAAELNASTRAFPMFVKRMWYVALLYRFSIKSTIWLWWPLAFIRSVPPDSQSDEEMRVRA